MREIKFRAWDKENKKMVYYDTDCSAPNMTLDGVLEKCCFGRDVPGIAVHTNVSYQYDLMQYTGRKDKNGKGKDIYEGDKTNTGIVEWLETRLMWVCRTGEDTFVSLACINDIKVIGNIHEPEVK